MKGVGENSDEEQWKFSNWSEDTRWDTFLQELNVLAPVRENGSRVEKFPIDVKFERWTHICDGIKGVKSFHWDVERGGRLCITCFSNVSLLACNILAERIVGRSPGRAILVGNSWRMTKVAKERKWVLRKKWFWRGTGLIFSLPIWIVSEESCARREKWKSDERPKIGHYHENPQRRVWCTLQS